MRAQDCLYSVTDLAPGAGATRVVGASSRPCACGPTPRGSTSCCARPRSRRVTLTVTEKGYSRRAGTGGLDTAAPGVAARPGRDRGGPGPDLGTVVGRLAAGLAARFRAGGAPVDVVSCDNMAGNGAALAGVVRGFVEARRGPTARPCSTGWPPRSASRPPSSTGSCRPRPTTDRDAAAAALGVRDEMAGRRRAVPAVGAAGLLRRGRGRPGSSTARSFVAGRRAVPADEAAAAQRLPLRPGLSRGGRGLPTVAEVLATGWGERLVRALGAEVGADPARRGARTRPSTPTTWSTGSATPRCSTCCGRSAPTDR